jgi:DNA helicase-2/ATP-dependent DNA helicase PcrA
VLDVEHLLRDLTAPQRQAATHGDGPLLIVAGAGSGKTRVITRRVAYLISQGVPAWSILAITFTNKAAGEMKSRVAAVLDRPLRDFGQLHQPWPLICTFHSMCLRILKHYATRIGLPLWTPEQFAEQARDYYEKSVARVFVNYQRLLAQNNALDFDDLLIRAVNGLRDHPDVLAELQERFKYILIDEYQARTNRFTPGAAPTSATSSISRRIIPARRSSAWSRIIARPSASCASRQS